MGMPNGASKKALLGAFFFFKSLGFVKPKDNVVRCMLADVQASCFGVAACFGPCGLTRLSLLLVNSSRAVAERLAGILNVAYDGTSIELVAEAMNTEPSIVEYSIGAKGY